MEERSSSSSSSRTAREETDDWRTSLTPLIRRKILDTILGSLKMSSSDPDAQALVTNVVDQFEENVFHQARTKEDYARTISRKLKLINKPVHQIAGVSSSNPVDKPQQQQESKQFLKHKVHQPNNGIIHVGDNHNIHDHQQQRRIASQSSPLRSQNHALPTQSQQPPFSEQSSTTAFHQNQLVSQEYDVEEKLFPFWKSMPNSFQQPVGLQSNASCLRQQHRMIGPQLKAVNLKSHDHSAHALQREDTTLQSKVGQRVQRVNNFYHHLDSHNQRTQEATSQRPETPTFFLFPRNVNNQQKVFASQKGLAEVSSASLEPTAPSYQANNMDEFHDRAYQKLQIMRKNYFPSLAYLYDILNKKCQKSLMPEIVGNYKTKISQAEKLIKVLSMPRENLVLSSMEKLESFEQVVKLFLNSFNQGNLVSVQPPGGPSQVFQLQQQINGRSPSSLTHPVVLNSQSNMMNSPCSGSLMELKQQNAPSSLDHASRPEGHDIAGTQQNKFTHDARVMSFGSATKSLHQNTIINTFHVKKQLKHQMRQPQNVKQIMQSQMLLQIANNQPVTASASLPCTESASPMGKQQSSATMNPLERLLKAVQSISTKALSASVSEISSAMKIVDGVAGTVCNDSEADVGENLYGRNFSSQYGCSCEGKMKRKQHNSAMAPDTFSLSLSEADNLKQSTGQTCDGNSSETSKSKRRRIEPSNTLLDEIKYINQRLLETVIDLDPTEDIAAFDHGEGTIVRCTYNAVAFSEKFNKLHASLMSVFPLRLLVPASYPNASPVILDTFNFGLSRENKESIDISEKTMSRFSLSLRKLSEPISLAEMTMTWDACARAVLLEYAQSVGGGCFSSRYGKWE